MKKKINSYKNKPLAKQIEHKPNENKVRSWDNRLDVFKQNKAQKKMKHSSDWKKMKKSCIFLIKSIKYWMII